MYAGKILGTKENINSAETIYIHLFLLSVRFLYAYWYLETIWQFGKNLALVIRKESSLEVQSNSYAQTSLKLKQRCLLISREGNTKVWFTISHVMYCGVYICIHVLKHDEVTPYRWCLSEGGVFWGRFRCILYM